MEKLQKNIRLKSESKRQLKCEITFISTVVLFPEINIPDESRKDRYRYKSSILKKIISNVVYIINRCDKNRLEFDTDSHYIIYIYIYLLISVTIFYNIGFQPPARETVVPVLGRLTLVLQIPMVEN